MNVRVAAALIIAAAAAAALWAISRPPPGAGIGPKDGAAGVPPVQGTASGDVVGDGVPPAGPRTQPFESSTECKSCHLDVWNEWKPSFHGQAWTDPMVQALSGGFTQTECIDCHAPVPIHVTGVAVRVAPRRHAREDGVDCLTCHLMDDGVSVAATRAADTSGVLGACRPVAVPSMGAVDVCAGCHNQHETINELADSGIGKTCADCHMEPVTRRAAAGTRPGRSHVFPGAHDAEMHRRATKLEVSLDRGEVVAKVSNVGAGHKIPTDARHRSYNLWATAVDARGNVWAADEHFPLPAGEMRLYYRDQFKPTTQIAHGAVHEARWKVPGGFHGKVKVRLTYALNPDELAAKRVTEVWTAEVDVP